MIKNILILVLILSCFSVVVEAGEFPILEKQVEIRQIHLEWMGKITEKSMEGAISYFEGINGDVSEFNRLLSDFRGKIEKIGSLKTHAALNNLIIEMIKVNSEFREETDRQLKENNGNFWLLLGNIKDSLDGSKAELDSLKDKYWEVRKRNDLEIYDILVGRAQLVLDALKLGGYDIIDAQEKLNEIENNKDKLENALENQNEIEIIGVHLENLKLSGELAEIVEKMQIKIPEKAVIAYWIFIGDRAVVRSDSIISELEDLGLDVSELKSIHLKAKEDLKEAKSRFNEEDFNGAVEMLEKLKMDFVELGEAYDRLVLGVELGGMEGKVSAMSENLGEAAEGISEIRGKERRVS